MAQIPAGADCPGQLSRKQTGDAWELKARRWLEGKGLRFVAANVRGRGGEIDLIMKDGQTIVFVEVRFRQSFRFWRCCRQRDARQTTKIITDCPLVACPP